MFVNHEVHDSRDASCEEGWSLDFSTVTSKAADKTRIIMILPGIDDTIMHEYDQCITYFYPSCELNKAKHNAIIANRFHLFCCCLLRPDSA